MIIRLSSYILLLSVLGITGCNQKGLGLWNPPPQVSEYVVVRDIHERPIFTVIKDGLTDSSSTQSQVLAQDAEKALLKLGLSVVSPPTLKIVSTQIGDMDAANSVSASTNGSKSNARTGSSLQAGTVTEKYYSYEDTDANYIVFTNTKMRRFEVVKKDTKEILALGDSGIFSKFDYDHDKSYQYRVASLFNKLGFWVPDIFLTKPGQAMADNSTNRQNRDHMDYKSHPSVSTNHVFAIFPEYLDSRHERLSYKTKSLLLSLGIRVVRKPQKRITETVTGGLETKDVDSNAASKSSASHVSKSNLKTGEKTETYYVYEDTEANHFIRINKTKGSFQIIRKDTRQIVAIESLHLLEMRNESDKNELYSLLDRLDIQYYKI